MIVFTNTMTQKKEVFNPSREGKVSMYVCGITPYDYPHIGHGRCYVTFDLVYRLLTFLGYDVTYARNFTDIDDKILTRASKELGDALLYKDITKPYIKAFGSDMKQLNCKVPNFEPLVTEMIPQIIAFTQGLIQKGAAYQKDGSVYFRVLSFAQYGQLSKQKIKDLDSGSRVEIDECKENPLDFALWKRDDIVGFESPWGMGRPGWHIECSAMVHDIFQGSIDIHGGGMDLMFPHHENEIAQSESLYPEPFVKYWLHNAFVRINKEKMSKSLNNFFTLQEVFEKFDPMVVRFYFLKHHYRGPLDFSFQDLISTQTAYKRIVDFFAETQEAALSLTEQDFVVSRMLECLKDDLNTSGVFGVLFESLPLLQKDNKSKSLVKSFLVNVLGLTLAPMIHKEVEITPEIKLLLDQRDIARQEKDWALSDQLRLKLEQLGVAIQDKKLK